VRECDEAAYLPLLLGDFDEDDEPGLPLGEDDEPDAAPPEVDPEDELPVAEDGLLPIELVPPAPALLSRLQPASARARDAARMASSFMNPPIDVVPALRASIRPLP
jgi:hypothetical protein